MRELTYGGAAFAASVLMLRPGPLNPLLNIPAHYGIATVVVFIDGELRCELWW